MTSRILTAAALSALIAATGTASAQTYQAIDDESLAVPGLNVTVGELEDMDLLNGSGEEIGDVEEVLMEAGTISGVAVEVGGFLGIGEKTVVLPLDQLTVVGDDVTTNMTVEELEALPEWED